LLFELPKVHVKLSQSAGETVPDSWSSDRETSVAQSSTGPRDGADAGVDRTKMTAPRVVGNELAFFCEVRWGLASQPLKYQHGQLVLDSCVALATREVASKPAKYGHVAALLSRDEQLHSGQTVSNQTSVADDVKYSITIVQTIDERLDRQGLRGFRRQRCCNLAELPKLKVGDTALKTRRVQPLSADCQ